MHSDFIVFADESGDHSLAKINPDYPVFVLSFCIFRKTDYVESVCPLLQRFKLRWWAHDGVVLHSMRIKRQEFPFVFLKTLGKRERFMADLTDTLARCPFTIIAAVIDKVRLRNQYLQPENPYSLALKFCLERVHHFFRDRGQVFRETAFLFECRGKREDAELARIFRRLASVRITEEGCRDTRSNSSKRRPICPGCRSQIWSARPLVEASFIRTDTIALSR